MGLEHKQSPRMKKAASRRGDLYIHRKPDLGLSASIETFNA
jgi:hypothetical protein